MIDNPGNLTELYRIYRPKKFKDVIGQDEAVALLQQQVSQNKIPHCVIFTGPTGVGKTTLAKILATKIGCMDQDRTELNAASSRGIDTIREISQRLHLAPLGKSRVWILDECQQFTNDAQSALLTILENAPSHAYFFFCTTDAVKLKGTVKNRCTIVHLKPLTEEHITTILKSVAIQENTTLSDELIGKILQHGDGSARDALGLLQKALNFVVEEDRLKAVIREDAQAYAKDLANILVWGKEPWEKVVEVLKRLHSESAEDVRRYILGCALKKLYDGGNQAIQGYNLVCLFDGSPFPDGKAGHAVLASRCWEYSKKTKK
jgi:DNA polymerase III gamma/tau subunit